jgi:hypothetical protein
MWQGSQRQQINQFKSYHGLCKHPKEDKMTAILHPTQTYHPTKLSLDKAQLKAQNSAVGICPTTP